MVSRVASQTIFLLLFFCFSFVVSGCFEDTAPGTFSLVFQWSDGKPQDTSSLGIWGKVEKDGLQVAESSMLAYQNGVQLDFISVPNGDNLTIYVEIKEALDKTSRTLYFGQSESFSLEAGQHTEVPIRLSLNPTPSADQEDTGSSDPLQLGAVSVVRKETDSSYTSCLYTNQSVVILSLAAPDNCESPCFVIVSNNSDFRSTEDSLPLLSELTANGDRFIKPDWDLNYGASDLDGVRTVYVKFRNAYGYESGITTGQVTMDRVAPDVASGSVTPTYANETLTVTMTPNDILLENNAPKLFVYEEGNSSQSLAELDMTATGGGESYLWEGFLSDLTTDTNTLDGAILTFAVTMTDKAGNTTDGEIPFDNDAEEPYRVTVDVTTPVIEKPVTIQPQGSHLGHGETLSVSFSITESVGLDLERLSVKAGKKAFQRQNAKADAYMYTLDTNAITEEGLTSLVVEVFDLAGNAVADSVGTKTFDFTEPVLQLAIQPDKEAFALNETVTIMLTSGSDPLDEESLTLEVNPSLLGTLSERTGEDTEFRWTYTVQEGDSGIFSFSLDTALDLAGNPGASINTQTKLDGNLPKIELFENLSENHSSPTDYRFSVTFKVTDENLDTLEAVLANEAGYRKAMTQEARQEADTYRFIAQVDAATEEHVSESPFFTVSLAATDQAGNTKNALSNTIQLDIVPPEISSLDLTVEKIYAGGSIQLVLTADKRLQGPPDDLKASDADETYPIAFQAVSPASGQLRYVMEAVWPETMPPTDSLHIYEIQPCTLVDTVGNSNNSAEFLPATTFTVDTFTPRLDGDIAFMPDNGSTIGGEASITLSFNVSENDELAAGWPKVRLGSYEMSLDEATGHTYRFLYNPDENETEIKHNISIELKDEAGNQVFLEDLGEYTFDFTKPILTVIVEPEDRPAGKDETVTISVTSSEMLDSNPSLMEDPGWVSLSGPSIQGGAFVWTATVSENEVSSYDLSFSATDLAGNDAETVNQTILVDGAKPILSSIDVTGDVYDDDPVLNNWFGAHDDFDNLTLEFTLTESALLQSRNLSTVQVSATLEVSGGSLDLSCQALGDPTSSLDFTCTRDDRDSGGIEGLDGLEGSGRHTITIEAVDAAGNVTRETKEVEFDFDAPQAAGCSVFPDPANANSFLTARISLDEALQEDFEPVLWLTDGETRLKAFNENPLLIGKTFTFDLLLEEQDGGSYGLEIEELCDRFGNCLSDITDGMCGFAVDDESPSVSSLMIYRDNDEDPPQEASTFSLKTGFDKLLAVVTFSEEPATWDVTLDGQSQRQRCEADTEHENRVWECPITAEGTDGTFSTHTISAFIQDAAGNRGSTDRTVTYDFKPPTVTSALISPDTGRMGSLLTYQFATDEALQGDLCDFTATNNPELPNDTWSDVSGSDQSYSYTLPVNDAVEDSFEASVARICDAVNNCADNVGAALFAIDSITPVIGGLAVDDPKATYSDEDCCNEMLITFSLSSLAEEIIVRVDDDIINVESACETSGSEDLDYSCTYIVGQPSEEDDNHIITPAIIVETRDAVGNSDNDSISVTFDYQPPFLIGTALLERCDGYSPAREAQDILWVKNGNQCTSEDQESCQYKGADCPYSYNNDSAFAPIRLSFALQENTGLGDQDIYIDQDGYGSFTLANDSTETYKVAYYNQFVDTSVLEDIDSLTVVVKAHVVDDYENDAEIEVATLTFDYKTPDPPDVNTSDRIVYHRIPWGSDATDGESKMWVEGEAGAVESYTTEEGEEPRYGKVRVYRPQPKVMLSEGESHPDGSFPELEFGADLPEVAVAYFDLAGNESDSAFVRDIEWTATMGGKVPESTIENPQVFSITPYFMPTLEQISIINQEPVLEDMIRLNTHDEDSIKGVAECRWLELFSNNSKPYFRTQHAMVYDPIRGQTVLFGGHDYTNEVDLQDTWIWNGSSGIWVERHPQGDIPSARNDSSIIYDTVLGKTLIFGGSGVDIDIWAWDDASETWTELIPSGDVPLGRRYHAVVYDSKRGKAVLFGGQASGSTCNGSHYCQDTWEWDSATSKWTEIVTEGEVPNRRGHHAMVYDSNREKVVLYGGYAYREGCNEEWGDYCSWVWEYDGLVKTWTKVVASGIIPRARERHAMAYDSKRKLIVMFGGTNWDDGCELESSSYCDWTWEWDGELKEWSKAVISGDEPSARYSHSMVYDRGRHKCVLFGGNSKIDTCRIGGNICGDIWELDLSSGIWQNKTPDETKPNPRNNYTIARDISRDRVLMFGGRNGTGCNEEYDDYCSLTWEWNPESNIWADVSPDNVKPGPRIHHAMSYDRYRSKAILFGGYYLNEYFNDMWEWDGINRTWTALVDEENTPSSRRNPGMTYDNSREQLFLFGGDNNGDGMNDTWVWDSLNESWSNLDGLDNSPTERSFLSVIFDELTEKVFLFGGTDGLWSVVQDTWEWDGLETGWTERIILGEKPASRSGNSLVYDSRRNRIVLFGGYAVFQPLQDTWVWDSMAETWSDWTPSGNKPSDTNPFGMIYDELRDKIFLFEGTNENWPIWEWDWAGDNNSAAIIRFPFKFSQADNETIRSVAISLYAGGSAYSNEGEDGSTVFVWDNHPGNWRELTSNGSDVENPDLLTYQSSDPEELPHLFFSDEQSLNIAVTPAYPNGTGTKLSEVSVDYVEATVKYYLGSQYGWGFDKEGETDGWITVHISNPTVPQGGVWTLTIDQSDPFIKSPTIALDAEDYTHVQVKMKNATTSQIAYFLWTRSDESYFGGAKMIDFPVETDNQWYTYKAELAGNSEWNGTITQVRFDPVEIGDDQEVAIDWIRLTSESYSGL